MLNTTGCLAERPLAQTTPNTYGYDVLKQAQHLNKPSANLYTKTAYTPQQNSLVTGNDRTLNIHGA